MSSLEKNLRQKREELRKEFSSSIFRVLMQHEREERVYFFVRGLVQLRKQKEEEKRVRGGFERELCGCDRRGYETITGNERR